MTLNEFKTTEFYKTTLDYYVSSGRFTEEKAKDILKAKVLDIFPKGAKNQVTVEFQNGLILDIEVARSQLLPRLSEYIQVKLLNKTLHLINS